MAMYSVQLKGPKLIYVSHEKKNYFFLYFIFLRWLTCSQFIYNGSRLLLLLLYNVDIVKPIFVNKILADY